MNIRASTAVAIALIAAAACSPENSPKTGPAPVVEEPARPGAAEQPEDVLRLSGTVHHLDLEGGVYVIRTADGTQYRPIELPEEFRVDGLAVEVNARRRDDVMTVDMAGQAIELLDIRKRAGD